MEIGPPPSGFVQLSPIYNGLGRQIALAASSGAAI